MDFLTHALINAFRLVTSGDPDLFNAVWISLRVSCAAIVITSVIAGPLGFWLAIGDSAIRRFLLTISQALMAVPTVVVGLILYTLLFRSGPLGVLGLLFTPTAMMIGEIVLTLPLVISLVASAVQQLDPRYREEAWMLGARRWRLMTLLFNQARSALAVALFTGLSRAISEVGAAMMLGGNIRGYTRNITTTIALETSKGEFALGIALGLILLIIAFGLHFSIIILRRRLNAG